MRLDELNAASEEVAVSQLLRCCGSDRWARQMASARPFEAEEAMIATADRVWTSLAEGDWLQAFAAHPRIGDRRGAALQPGWAAQEQAAAATAEDAVTRRLAEANREYEAHFGYIFIVCATGKSGDEMLKILETRLHSNPADELATAGEEQRKITRLRLVKLLQS